MDYVFIYPDLFFDNFLNESKHILEAIYYRGTTIIDYSNLHLLFVLSEKMFGVSKTRLWPAVKMVELGSTIPITSFYVQFYALGAGRRSVHATSSFHQPADNHVLRYIS